MDRSVFYDYVRKSPFPGRLMQTQVEGMEAILNEWDKRQEPNDKCEWSDTRWLAYMLATAFHETAHTMQPIREYGGKTYLTRNYDVQGSKPARAIRHGNTEPGDGIKYCGRGYVQLTWKNNYATFSKILDVDLVTEPDRALEPEIATQIMFEGMTRGSYTGRALKHYFQQGDAESDWFNARRIVNGLDKADKIAREARAFWRAILRANGEFDRAAAVPKGSRGVELPAEYLQLGQEFGDHDSEWY